MCILYDTARCDLILTLPTLLPFRLAGAKHTALYFTEKLKGKFPLNTPRWALYFVTSCFGKSSLCFMVLRFPWILFPPSYAFTYHVFPPNAQSFELPAFPRPVNMLALLLALEKRSLLNLPAPLLHSIWRVFFFFLSSCFNQSRGQLFIFLFLEPHLNACPLLSLETFCLFDFWLLAWPSFPSDS